jgi:hypothetical protein
MISMVPGATVRSMPLTLTEMSNVQQASTLNVTVTPFHLFDYNSRI